MNTIVKGAIAYLTLSWTILCYIRFIEIENSVYALRYFFFSNAL